MKLTKGVITREAAFVISPEYVEFVEGKFDHFSYIDGKFSQLKKGQPVLTYNHENKQFVMAKVTKVDHESYQAIEGPVIRVSNEEYSWRVDGSGYAFPLPGLAPKKKKVLN